LIQILKVFIRAALYLFCYHIDIKHKYLVSKKGPLLIIANHPNSFLDAIIIAAQYKRKVYFLARGDAFHKKFHRYILRSLNMIPVYRKQEGKQYLHLNDNAFTEAINLLKMGFAVCIFIEGICLNTHQLQPFKKGTARIIEGTHNLNVFPTIHVVGIAYNQLRGIGKKVNLEITEYDLTSKITTVMDRIRFNETIFKILADNIHPSALPTTIKKTPLFYLHYYYYKWIFVYVAKKTKNTVFFDSILFSVLFFTYPLFLFFLFICFQILGIPLLISIGILIIIPILNKYTVE